MKNKIQNEETNKIMWRTRKKKSSHAGVFGRTTIGARGRVETRLDGRDRACAVAAAALAKVQTRDRVAV